jgi:hypothetical protein
VTAPARARRDRTRRDPTLTGGLAHLSQLTEHRRTALPVVPAVVVAGLAVSLVGLAVAMQTTSYDIWAAFWITPLLLLATVPIASRLAKLEGDPGLGRLIMAAAVLKVVGGSAARYVMTYGIYGTGDANRYHNAGAVLAPAFRSGDYSTVGELTGTRFLEVLTGHVYVVTGATRLGGFVVFSWLAFLGLCFFYRAHRIAVPEGDPRRYRLLLFFFPALLFWPSSTGKEAWMFLCVGAASYGFAKLFTRQRAGLVFVVLGLWGAVVVRPHLPLVFMVGACVALPVRLFLQRREGRLAARWGTKGLLLVGLVIAASLVVARAEEFFELDRLDAEAAEEVTERVERQTARGGSEFQSPDARNPVGYVAAVVTVLFRPLIVEAHNVPSLISATEGLLLLGLMVASTRRLARFARAVFRSPYLMFAVAYSAAFVYAFSAIENFGILVRQRAQLLPVLFIVLALYPTSRSSTGLADPVEDEDGVSHSTAGQRPPRPAAHASR